MRPFKGKIIAAAVILLSILFAAMCNEDSVPTSLSLSSSHGNTAFIIRYVSGNNQTGSVNTKLEQPFTVQVQDN
ncbi:MAG: hypothetical protein U9N45_06560, partial [Gemmatimonadota bacterium]|nr:hypothetical protein [Gemmatimonadota bacterium]